MMDAYEESLMSEDNFDVRAKFNKVPDETELDDPALLAHIDEAREKYIQYQHEVDTTIPDIETLNSKELEANRKMSSVVTHLNLQLMNMQNVADDVQTYFPDSQHKAKIQSQLNELIESFKVIDSNMAIARRNVEYVFHGRNQVIEKLKK